jgi:5-methylcytosine-specific restriction protein A
MRNDIYAELKKLQRPDERRRGITRRGRFIRPEVYNMLKRRKVCDYCHKSMLGEVPEIHHIIPISDGGTNMLNNLMALHKRCHQKLDEKQRIENDKSYNS